MPRGRSVAQREKDNQALEYRRRGFRYDQIAKAMGMRSKASAHEAVQRALSDNAREASDEVRSLELDRLDDMARAAQGVLARQHFAFTQSGKLVTTTDPVTGEDVPVLDDGPTIAALGQLLRISESRRRLLGLDAPTRTRVEVVTPEMIEDQIRETEQRIAAAGARPVGPGQVIQLKALPAGDHTSQQPAAQPATSPGPA